MQSVKSVKSSKTSVEVQAAASPEMQPRVPQEVRTTDAASDNPFDQQAAQLMAEWRTLTHVTAGERAHYALDFDALDSMLNKLQNNRPNNGVACHQELESETESSDDTAPPMDTATKVNVLNMSNRKSQRRQWQLRDSESDTDTDSMDGDEQRSPGMVPPTATRSGAFWRNRDSDSDSDQSFEE